MIREKIQNVAGGADWQAGYRDGLKDKGAKPQPNIKNIRDYMDGYEEGLKEKKERDKFRSQNSFAFENGRVKAEREIGRKLENAAKFGKTVEVYKGYPINEYNGEFLLYWPDYFVIDSKHKSLQEARQKADKLAAKAVGKIDTTPGFGRD